MERRNRKVRNKWLMQCPGCKISTCLVDSDDGRSISQESIPACSDDSDETESTSLESIPSCSDDSDEIGSTSQELVPIGSVDPDEAGHINQKRIPAYSVDPDEAGSTSQESNLMDHHAASNNWNHVAAGGCDINSVEENTNKVRQKLIETGQMDKLKDLMERRLSEVGWRIDMMAKCREIVQMHGSKTSFEMLFQPLRQEGKDLVPDKVKDDVLQKIKYCYESETKEN